MIKNQEKIHSILLGKRLNLVGEFQKNTLQTHEYECLDCGDKFNGVLEPKLRPSKVHPCKKCRKPSKTSINANKNKNRLALQKRIEILEKTTNNKVVTKIEDIPSIRSKFLLKCTVCNSEFEGTLFYHTCKICEKTNSLNSITQVLNQVGQKFITPFSGSTNDHHKFECTLCNSQYSLSVKFLLKKIRTGQEICMPCKRLTVRKTSYAKCITEAKEQGFTLLTQKDVFISESVRKPQLYRHNECGTEFDTWPHTYHRCPKCHPKSKEEIAILNFSKTLTNGTIKHNNRTLLSGEELDIYMEENNIAIEYDGVYFHSNAFKQTDYHLNKTVKCEELGIRLFHIFENEWLVPTKQDIWKSILTNVCSQSTRIFARKTDIRPVSSSDSKKFLEENHLQGACVSSVRYGLYLDDVLVSLMTFGKSRFNKKIDWELIRFCNKKYTTIVGGASKLFKHFLKNHSGSVISYADRRRSQGNLYKQLGFDFSHNSVPNFMYVKNRELFSRQKFQKHKLKNQLKNFDPEKTAEKNMEEHGYRKIYDCGNQVWIYKN
jgi:hypothetical protein